MEQSANYKKSALLSLVLGLFVLSIINFPCALAARHLHTQSQLTAEEALAQKEVEAINASLYAHTRSHALPVAATADPVSAPIIFTTESGADLWSVMADHFSLGDYSNRPEVRHEILWYLSRRGILNQMLQNAVPYLYYVYQQTQQRHMPAEFALLPLVESGYDPFAYSQAGATGLWQMMPGTASSFGLDINWWYDARRDTVVSTQAALNFLGDLHDMTRNWLLTAASYDVGVGAVQAAQQYNARMMRDTNFWDLPLPKETRDYVPRLLALAEIIKHPNYYGVKLPYIPDQPYFAAINMNSQIDLAEVSHFANVPIDIIHRLNPAMLRWATNPDALYTLLVPYKSRHLLMQNLKAVAGKEHITWQYHEIRTRETLASIAKNYHTSMGLLEQVNDLNSEQLTPNQGLLVPLYLHRTYSAPVVTAAVNNHLPLTQLAQPITPLLPTTISANNSSAPNGDSLKSFLGKVYQSN